MDRVKSLGCLLLLSIASGAAALWFRACGYLRAVGSGSSVDGLGRSRQCCTFLTTIIKFVKLGFLVTMLLNRSILTLIQKKGGEIIHYTTWQLGPHRSSNSKDGSKTWLSDGNTKKEVVKKLQEGKNIEALHTSHS